MARRFRRPAVIAVPRERRLPGARLPLALAELLRKGYMVQFLFLVDRIAFINGFHVQRERINEFMNECNNIKDNNSTTDVDDSTDFDTDGYFDADGSDTSNGSSPPSSSSSASSSWPAEVARSAVADMQDAIIAGGGADCVRGLRSW